MLTKTGRIILEGKKFGRLSVMGPVRTSGKAIKYRCVCDCGKEAVVSGQNIRLGLTQSCGCLRDEKIAAVRRRHGLSKTSIHNIWTSMLSRCEAPNSHAFKDYGARGITVCKEWHEFETFLADMGIPDSGMTLDRIDNDLGYCKSNCRWATKTEQANNRRSNKVVSFQGKEQTLAAWERELGLKPKTISNRITSGWDVERALTTKVTRGNACR